MLELIIFNHMIQRQMGELEDARQKSLTPRNNEDVDLKCYEA